MIFPTKEFIDTFKKTPGALSVAESIAIMNVAKDCEEGLYAEYGTYMGKSAMSALYALPCGVMYLYEPDFANSINSRDVYEKLRGMEFKTYDIQPSSKYSIDAISDFDEYSFVMVDSGSHQGGLPMQEAKLLEDRMASGGIIAWHDFGNQFCEPKEAAKYLVNTGKYEWVDIDWQQIFDWMKENDVTENGNDSWHQYPELPHSPNFVGAIKRK